MQYGTCNLSLQEYQIFQLKFPLFCLLLDYRYIDYFLTETKWKTSMRTVNAKPDDLCRSDHQLLAASICLKALRKNN